MFTRYEVPEESEERTAVGLFFGFEDVVDLAEATCVSNTIGLEAIGFNVGACDCGLIVGVGFIVGLNDDGLNEGWVEGLEVDKIVGLLVGFSVG